MSYENPIDVILRHEGKFTSHSSDKGNWYKGKLVGTNYGITGATLAKWLRRDVTMDDVKNMTEEEAREIYETNYLTGPRIHTLPEPPQTLVLDMSVNHGPRTAIKMLQKVLNQAGFGPVDTDGIMGPQTRNACIAAQEAMGPYLQNAIVEERIKFYQNIVRRDSSQKVFLNGWLNRARSFLLPIGTDPVQNKTYSFSKYRNQLPPSVYHLLTEMEDSFGNEKQAIELLQRTVNLTELVQPLAVDGLIGPRTINATVQVFDQMASVLVDAIREEWSKTR